MRRVALVALVGLVACGAFGSDEPTAAPGADAGTGAPDSGTSFPDAAGAETSVSSSIEVISSTTRTFKASSDLAIKLESPASAGNLLVVFTSLSGQQGETAEVDSLADDADDVFEHPSSLEAPGCNRRGDLWYVKRLGDRVSELSLEFSLDDVDGSVIILEVKGASRDVLSIKDDTGKSATVSAPFVAAPTSGGLVVSAVSACTSLKVPGPSAFTHLAGESGGYLAWQIVTSEAPQGATWAAAEPTDFAAATGVFLP